MYQHVLTIFEGFGCDGGWGRNLKQHPKINNVEQKIPLYVTSRIVNFHTCRFNNVVVTQSGVWIHSRVLSLISNTGLI